MSTNGGQKKDNQFSAQGGGSGIDNYILKITEKIAKIPKLARDRRWVILLAVTLLTGLFGFGTTKMKMEQSFEAFFPDNDTSTADYRLFRSKFGSDETLILMYKPKNGNIFSKESLLKIQELEDRLNEERLKQGSPLDRITRIRSIVSADYLEVRGDSMINRKFIGKNIPQTKEQSEALKKKAMAHKDYPGSFFSKDLQYGLITLTTDFSARLAENPSGDSKEESSKKSKNNEETKTDEISEFDFEVEEEVQNTNEEKSGSKDETKWTKLHEAPPKTYFEALEPQHYEPAVTELRKQLHALGWSPLYKQVGVDAPVNEDAHTGFVIAGNPWIQDFIVYLLKTDFSYLMLGSLLIIFLMLALSFRSLSATVWPFIIIMLAQIWMIGFTSYIGIAQSMMVTIVIFLILTLGVASSVHILSGFKIFLKEGQNKEEALTTSYKKSGFSVILASLTTMGGLSALILMPLVPIRNFGITAAVGIFFALLLTLFLLPVLLSFWAPYKKGKDDSHISSHNPVEIWFQHALNYIGNIAIEHPRKIMVVFALVVALGMAAFNRMKIDTSFTDMTPRGHGITETFDIIDEHFGGTSSVEIVVDTGQTEGIRTASVVKAMDQFTEKVLTDRSDFVARGFSVAKAIKESHRVLTDGSEANYKLPTTDSGVSQVLVMYDSADAESRRMMVDDDWRSGRISLQVYTKSSYEYEGFMKDLNTWTEEYLQPLKAEFPNLKVTITGAMPMMMSVVDFISFSQVRSFILALIVVSIILLLIYGSARFGILAIIPNLVPMAVIIGVAGWFELALDTDTLIVMPLAIGIVVDDTIHFLTHYRAELAHGATAQEAIRTSLKEVGQAMMFTSFILVGGFAVFLISIYTPFVKFGILSGTSILAALLADLFLLPALLITFYPEEVASKEAADRGWGKKAQIMVILAVFLVAAFFLASPVSAQGSLKEPKKARSIANKMIERDDGRSSYTETTMITCSFKVESEKRKCKTKPRRKIFEGISKDIGKNGRDSIQLSILIKPVSEKGVAFLQKDFDKEGKDSEQWMYLPAMKKLKRVVGESENAPKTGSVFGSEFSFEDIEKQHISDYDYSLVSEETFEGIDVWVIESFPRKKRRAKTSYGRSKSWVDKKNYIALKTELYDKQNHLKKTMLSRGVQKIGKVWTVRKFIVVNHRNQRMSLMKTGKMALNIKVSDNIFKFRALKEIGYRERILKKLRSKAK